MTYRILLDHVRAALHMRSSRHIYAAVTRPDAALRWHAPSFCFDVRSLARRSALARQLTGIEVHHD